MHIVYFVNIYFLFRGIGEKYATPQLRLYQCKEGAANLNVTSKSLKDYFTFSFAPFAVHSGMPFRVKGDQQLFNIPTV